MPAGQRNRQCQPVNEVTFICPGHQLEIRLTDQVVNSVCDAALTLKARYFVMIDEAWRVDPNRSLGDGVGWGVFDMQKADKDNPFKGQWTLNDPVKTFPIDALDGAVMYALMLDGQKR